jgi:hypothetical protein
MTTISRLVPHQRMQSNGGRPLIAVRGRRSPSITTYLFRGMFITFIRTCGTLQAVIPDLPYELGTQVGSTFVRQASLQSIGGDGIIFKSQCQIII